MFSRLLNFIKNLLNFITMRRLLMRVVNRILMNNVMNKPLIEATPAAGIHTRSRRKLVVGLGNTGLETTRHSVGMVVLGALAARLGLADRWHGDRHVSGEVIESELQSTRLILLRPKLLMNVNGVSVARAAAKYRIQPEDVLLVHDDLDKPLGKVSVKHGGSARGHNGVRSCVQCLQTDAMLRLRVGIGRPAHKSSVQTYVLGRFSKEEQEVLDSVLVQSVDLLLEQLSQGDPQSSSSSSSPAGGSTAQSRRKHSTPPDDQR